MEETITITIPGSRETMTLTNAQARQVLGQLMKFMGGGRKAIIEPCRYCGIMLGVRERRYHEPSCPKRFRQDLVKVGMGEAIRKAS